MEHVPYGQEIVAGSSPTLRTIARHTGYGLVTVSYALRDHPRVQAATRQEIQAAARALGYRPNPLVTALMADVRAARPPKHAGTIASLARWTEAARDLNARANELFLRGAAERAEKLGWKIDDIPCDHDALRRNRLNQILTSRGIHGVLIGPLPSGRYELDLDWSRYACATWGYSLRSPVLHRAAVHHGHAVTLAFEQARAAGARRIGLATLERTNARADHLYEAAMHIQQKALPSRDRVTPFMPGEAGWGLPAFTAWLQRERPEVIVTPNDLRPWLARAGAAGRRAQVLTMDRSAHDFSGSGVDYCHEAVGAAAIDLIITQMNANERGLPLTPTTVLIEGRWVGEPFQLRPPAAA